MYNNTVLLSVKILVNTHIMYQERKRCTDWMKKYANILSHIYLSGICDSCWMKIILSALCYNLIVSRAIGPANLDDNNELASLIIVASRPVACRIPRIPTLISNNEGSTIISKWLGTLA